MKFSIQKALSLSVLIFVLINIYHSIFESETNIAIIHGPQKPLPTLIEIERYLESMDALPLFSKSPFAKYRNKSIRYYGNQQRMKNLLTRLFTTVNGSLKIAITGGSISVPRSVKVIRLDLWTICRLKYTCTCIYVLVRRKNLIISYSAKH